MKLVSFRYRDKEIPEHVGQYTIQFSLGRNETKVLFSSQVSCFPTKLVSNTTQLT